MRRARAARPRKRLLQWQAAVSEDSEREDAPGGHDDEAMRPSSTGSEQPAEEAAREHVRRARLGWVCAGVLALRANRPTPCVSKLIIGIFAARSSFFSIWCGAASHPFGAAIKMCVWATP